MLAPKQISRNSTTLRLQVCLKARSNDDKIAAFGTWQDRRCIKDTVKSNQPTKNHGTRGDDTTTVRSMSACDRSREMPAAPRR